MGRKFSTTLRGLDQLSKVAAARPKPEPEPEAKPEYFMVAENGGDGTPVMVRLDKLIRDARYQYNPETEQGRLAQLKKWMEDDI